MPRTSLGLAIGASLVTAAPCLAGGASLELLDLGLATDVNRAVVVSVAVDAS